MGKLHLISGDIIENSHGMDAIVNPQNKYMENGSGVCGLIYSSAGSDLYNYCRSNYLTNMNTCEVRITPGFNLNMYVIHIFAPIAFEEIDPINKLLECYDNLLKSIIDNKYKKVIVPSIGCGIHGYKHNDVAKPLMKLLNNFCKNNDVDIYFVNCYPIYTDIYLKELISINGIDLNKDLKKSNNILNYLFNNGLTNFNSKDKYNNFCDGKELNDMCLEEKIICLQYTLENYNLQKKDLITIIDTL